MQQELITAIKAKEDAEERLRVVDAVYRMAAEALPFEMRVKFNEEMIKNAKGKKHILELVYKRLI